MGVDYDDNLIGEDAHSQTSALAFRKCWPLSLFRVP